MVLRRLWIAVMAIAASAFLVVSANAVPVQPGDPTIHNLVFGAEYKASQLIAPNTASFTHDYKFAVIDNPLSLSVGSFGISFPGQYFTSLKFEVFDLANLVVPLGSLDLLTAPFYNTALPVLLAGSAPTGSYLIRISGGTGDGLAGGYGFKLSAVPVPPAILLLLSGLMGAGFMGRRKMRVSKVSV